MLTYAETALRRAVTSTFEQVAFLLLDPADSPEHGNFISRERQVSFRGPVSGRLVLRVDANALPQLAMNMLAADEEPTPAEQMDALGELANMVCGNVAPELTADPGLFTLNVEPPACHAGVPVVPEQLVGSVAYCWDGGAMECSIYASEAR